MSNEIMQENTPFVECSSFHRGMSVLEASLRNTEDSEAIISGLLKGAAEFYGTSRECTNYFKCNFHPLHQTTVLLCKQAAKIFQTICKKETALKRVLRNLLSAVSFTQI